MAINAIRLRTPEPKDEQGRYRYLQAMNGGDSLLAPVRVASPLQWETFLFESPTTWPLMSGDQLSMNLCNSKWDGSGLLVRAGWQFFPEPSHGKGGRTGYWDVGGADTEVWVKRWSVAPFPDAPADRIFHIVKPGGGQINSGDAVSLRVDSEHGSTWFFRVTDPGGGPIVFANGAAAGQLDTTFIVEFVEVHSGIGLCGAVNGVVTRSADGQPIQGAKVEALDMGGARTILCNYRRRRHLHPPPRSPIVPYSGEHQGAGQS